MSMGDLQFWSASGFAHSLRAYTRQRGPGWYVAAMMPILYRWRDQPRKKHLAPDTFEAFVPDHPHESFDAEFTPQAAGPSTLTGYRRSASGRFVAWKPDREGQLWSEVLHLYLVVRGREIRALTADGRLLPNPEEAETARQEAEAGRRAAETARQHEAIARQQAEAEIARLRQELESQRRQTP